MDGGSPNSPAAEVGAAGTHSNGTPPFEGRYGRLFPEAEVESLPSEEALRALASAMILPNDIEKEGPNDHESGIPAAYTYFGQFVAHDLSFDPASLTPQCPARPPTQSYRSARCDLDSLYGRGPSSHPDRFEAGNRFLLGRSFARDWESTSKLASATDLPRLADDTAAVADGRNDSQRILAQVHDIFMRFHNRMVLGGLSFEEAQREVRLHYQWLLLNDFLPKIVPPSLLQGKAGLPLRPEFTLFPATVQSGTGAQTEPFVPLEFSVAAFRFGHAMARVAYRLNRTIDSSFTVLAANRATSLFGFAPAMRSWGIDWDLFIDLSETPRPWLGPGRLQLAHQIDTALVNPLGNIPLSAAGLSGSNLALLDLLRARGVRLPSGQAVARQMGLEPLPDDQILIGSPKQAITQVAPSLAGNCPLWVYVLAEATSLDTKLQTMEGEKDLKTRVLGDVGGRIVSETVLRLLVLDPDSLVHQANWAPNPVFAPKGVFGLAELIRAALENDTV